MIHEPFTAMGSWPSSTDTGFLFIQRFADCTLPVVGVGARPIKARPPIGGSGDQSHSISLVPSSYQDHAGTLAADGGNSSTTSLSSGRTV